MICCRNASATCAVAITLLAVLSACSPEKSESKKEKRLAKIETKLERAEERDGATATRSDDPTRGVSDPSQFAVTGCDESLWNHVYDPARLERLAGCVAVTGTVEASSADDDGDQHFLLKLDAGQESLINKKNLKRKNGDLVVEIVCANPITLSKAKAACSGYKNSIPLPRVGSHVSVRGTYVIDSHNGWAEVHPVTSLQPASK